MDGSLALCKKLFPSGFLTGIVRFCKRLENLQQFPQTQFLRFFIEYSCNHGPAELLKDIYYNQAINMMLFQLLYVTLMGINLEVLNKSL